MQKLDIIESLHMGNILFQLYIIGIRTVLVTVRPNNLMESKYRG